MATRSPYEATAGATYTAANHARMARGCLGYTTSTSSDNSLTDSGETTNLSLTFSFEDDRRYRVHYAFQIIASATSNWTIDMYDTTNNAAIRRVYRRGMTAGETDWVTGSLTYTPGSTGSRQIVFRVTLNSGSGNISVQAGAGTEAELSVDDVGPAFS